MKILIAEDDTVSRRILESHLTRWGYDVVAARDGVEAWRMLQSEGSPRIAILDWIMPRMDGVEVCKMVRKESPPPYTYIILLTTLSSGEDLINGMNAGADDYLTKPYNANELRVRLRAGRRIIELQEELIAAREALREKASHDPLTGLWNHEEILRILGQELIRGEREGKCVGAIMADLDHFKLVNDNYGHLAGDAVLRMTAERILSITRPYDAIGRYGGEEFLLVLPDCSLENTTLLAERIRQHICCERMDTPEGLIPVTISLGVASAGCAASEDANSLVKRADDALYRAKEAGRNRVEADQKTEESPVNGLLPEKIRQDRAITGAASESDQTWGY